MTMRGRRRSAVRRSASRGKSKGNGRIMPEVNVRRRRASPNNRNHQQFNGFYVHSSPPKVVEMNPSAIRQWLRGGDVEQLERVVLDGRGQKLLGEYSPDPKVKNFLKTVPSYMSKISELHEAVAKGNLPRVKSLMTGDDSMKNIALCKDITGAGLLHKAVFNNHGDIVEWLIKNHPGTAKLRDRDGKTPLHYCGASAGRQEMWDILVEGGADPNAVDSKGRTPSYYMERPNAIELPEPKPPSGNRFVTDKGDLIVKPSNIRIWIHDKNLGRLQQVLWEGYGNKLRMETSNNPKVKRFLDSIPYAMNAIKDVHSAVVNDDPEEFAKKTADPVPVQILGSKDSNGLNPLHKACGLGRLKMAEDIIEKNQRLVSSTDNDGRTPLHYAAWQRINNEIYALLVDNDADEMAFDNNGRLPSYYKANPKEPLSKLLSVIPDAPRVSVSFPPTWDWGLLQSSARSSLNIPTLISTPTKEIQPERKSRSDYDLNALRPPDDLQQEFVFQSEETPKKTITIDKVSEKIVKVEEKLFADEKEEPSEEEGKTSPEKTSIDDRSNGEQLEGSFDKAVEIFGPSPRPQREIKLWSDEESATVEPEVQAPTEEHTENEEPEPSDEAEGQPVPLEEDDGGNEPNEAQSEDQSEESESSDKEKDEGDEKTEREIAEERQRLMDEGLLMVADDADDDESDGDQEVNEIISNGDMQGLATMVLDGEGEKLLGKKSSNPEIQGFLDNVSSYIAKIKAVHKAASSGDLRDLQAALDRRRFAVAKDGSNPAGMTPLHVAVLSGSTSIVKYLGGRFPETLNVKDKKGRTPLHYAAALSDNGQYFNTLLNLGADRKTKDNFSRVPSYYLENPGELTREMLLRESSGAAQATGDEPGDKDFGADDGKRMINDPSIHAREPDSQSNEGVPLSKPQDVDPIEEFGDEVEASFSAANRDEYGQTVLHFAAARSNGRSGLYQIIQESGINLGYRDELYRTARDVALQANIPENINEIDKFVLGLAARGETAKLVELLLEGYDHILDLEDDEDSSIIDIVKNKNQTSTLSFLTSIPSFEERRERVHRAIRAGESDVVEELVSESDSGKRLLIGKSTTSRCSLHIAILCQQEGVAEFIAQKYPETLKIGDNLERTALHYAMGVDKVETLSNILIKCGAYRLAKDLKGRQPTYYFMNKSDILRLQEEEELLRM